MSGYYETVYEHSLDELREFWRSLFTETVDDTGALELTKRHLSTVRTVRNKAGLTPIDIVGRTYGALCARLLSDCTTAHEIS